MHIVSNRKHLANQIKANVSWYDQQAKQRGQGSLSLTWIKYVAKLSSDQWKALKNGSKSLSITVYRKTFRLLKDMEESVLGTTYQPHHKIRPKLRSNNSMNQARRNMQKTLAKIKEQPKRSTSSNSKMNQAKQNLQKVLSSFNASKPSSKRVVTLIKAQKRKNRFNVYVNGYYAFPAGIDELSKYHLQIGTPISRSLQKKISESSNVSKMFDRASTRIIHHLRTEHEIRQWLRKKYDCSLTDADQVIKRLKNYHLINDEHYAHEYIRAEIVSGSKGPGAIIRHLKSKGINELTIQDAITHFYSADKQLKIAQHLAKDKFRMKVNTPFVKKLHKIKLALVRKGFSFDIANQAVDNCHFQPDHERQKYLLQRYTNQAFRRYGRQLKRINHYQIRMKIKRFLFRKGFDFDTIDQAIDDYKQNHE